MRGQSDGSRGAVKRRFWCSQGHEWERQEVETVDNPELNCKAIGILGCYATEQRRAPGGRNAQEVVHCHWQLSFVFLFIELVLAFSIGEVGFHRIGLT
jgi:hypothetical protein